MGRYADALDRLPASARRSAPPGLPELDEPINHLDIPSRSQFEQALSGFNGAVLAVVHDRYFIERFASGLDEVLDALGFAFMGACR